MHPQQLSHKPTVAMPKSVTDVRARPLRDLRISITDRCNFRCRYCMPKTVFGRDYPFLPRAELLSFEEITRLSRLFIALGVKKIRLTGGEPLLRHDLVDLIAQLAALSGLEDLTLTTNGALLPRYAAALKSAGLKRVTVSLDALDEAIFARMNDVGFPVAKVLEGIAAAASAGLTPIKINMVVRRSDNIGEILPIARHFRGSGHILRFIEYMDVGISNGWRMAEVVSSREVLSIIQDKFPLVAVAAAYPGEVAERWRYVDGAGEIGVISSVTRAFCGACSRARLSTDGRLYTCLFASQGMDLRALLRGEANDEQISEALTSLWQGRTDNYSEIRGQGGAPLQKIEMSYIGG